MRYVVRVYDEPGRDVDAGTDEVDGGAQRLLCRDCGQLVTSREQAFSPDGQGPERVFFNPVGLVMRILTVRHARGLGRVGGRSDEFTWFAGYSWQVAICAACGQHLGWLYEAMGERSPAVFWGLLLDRLVDGDQ